MSEICSVIQGHLPSPTTILSSRTSFKSSKGTHCFAQSCIVRCGAYLAYEWPHTCTRHTTYARTPTPTPPAKSKTPGPAVVEMSAVTSTIPQSACGGTGVELCTSVRSECVYVYRVQIYYINIPPPPPGVYIMYI